MSRSIATCLLLLSTLICLAASSAAADFDAVAVRLFSDGALVLVQRTVPAGIEPAEAAVRALVAGPTQDEAAQGLTSTIPAGTTIVGLTISTDSAEIDLSGGAHRTQRGSLQSIFDQFRATLGDFPWIMSIKLTCDGAPLSSYLAPPHR